MNLVIKGKNIEVPENTKDYITKKVDKFKRYVRNISKVTVEVSEEKTRSKDNRYVVEVTVDVQGTFIRGEERRADIFSAFDAVDDVMTRQMKRYKDRSQNRKRRTSVSKNEVAVLNENEADVADAQEAEIIKVKHFPLRPMSPEEAIDQMELLGHDFFVFFSNINEQINVVYRRKDGAYGLIEPELG